MKKFLTLVMALMLIVVSAFSFTACGEVDDVAKIKENGKLVVGVTIYKPMDYIDPETDDWTGFDAEMARKLGARLGVSVQFVIIDWSAKVMELNSGNIDCIWNGMTATSKLDQSLDFSVSYAENRQVAVIHKDNSSTINSVATVKAAAIAVENKSAGDTVATETLEATNITRVTAQVDAINEVLSNNSEVAVIDYTLAASVIGQGSYADLMIVDPDVVSFEREIFAVGVRTGSNLKAEIDKLFKDCYADGTMAALVAKYPSVVLNTEALGAL